MRIYNYKEQSSLSRYEQVLAMREGTPAQQKSVRRNVSKKSTQFALIVFAIAIFCMGFMTCTFLSKADSIVEAEAPRFKYVRNIEVTKGDTLWDIAGEYMSVEYEDRYAYIEEICEINHLSSWSIDAGDHLVVPYYASEYK